MVEGDSLGLSFLNLGDYSLEIEGKLNWKNKIEIRKLNIRILELKTEITWTQ